MMMNQHHRWNHLVLPSTATSTTKDDDDDDVCAQASHKKRPAHLTSSSWDLDETEATSKIDDGDDDEDDDSLILSSSTIASTTSSTTTTTSSSLRTPPCLQEYPKQHGKTVIDPTGSLSLLARQSTRKSLLPRPPTRQPLQGIVPQEIVLEEDTTDKPSRTAHVSTTGATATTHPRRQHPISWGKISPPPRSTTTRQCQSGFRHVSNLVTTDSRGAKGIYTGWVGLPTCMPHGNGRMDYEDCKDDVDGSRRRVVFYQGKWERGYWHGRGCSRDSNGNVYRGDFCFGKTQKCQAVEDCR